VYDAAGQKLSVTYQTAVAGVVIPMTNVMKPLTNAQISQTFKTDYCGNVIYENGAVSRILTEEGYITFNGTTPVYHYYLKDHQGNNRVVLNQDGTVEQVNHYYPFGGLMGESTAGGVQPYKYNGKELDRMHGLDLFDYGARHYDAAIGRWSTIDPMSEEYYSISPYAYCGNNPVNAIDPTGMSYDWFQSESGAVLWRDSQEKKLSIGGEIFNNIGKSYSLKMNDGSYLNYFDNVPLSVSNSPVNTWNKVLNNDALRGELLSRGSPLAESSKISLFQASIHKGQQDFIDHPLTQFAINSLLFIATGGLDVVPAAGGRIASQAAKGVTAEGAVWAQKTFSGTFSAGGKFAGQTVESVAEALRSGTLSVADVPINVVVRNGQTFILNTRSSAALMQAGIPRNAWNVVNQTGVSSFESMLTGQLIRNGLINGTNTIRQSGTQLILSH
jgi:RHS repeat-associated protein